MRDLVRAGFLRRAHELGRGADGQELEGEPREARDRGVLEARDRGPVLGERGPELRVEDRDVDVDPCAVPISAGARRRRSRDAVDEERSPDRAVLGVADEGAAGARRAARAAHLPRVGALTVVAASVVIRAAREEKLPVAAVADERETALAATAIGVAVTRRPDAAVAGVRTRANAEKRVFGGAAEAGLAAAAVGIGEALRGLVAVTAGAAVVARVARARLAALAIGVLPAGEVAFGPGALRRIRRARRILGQVDHFVFASDEPSRDVAVRDRLRALAVRGRAGTARRAERRERAEQAEGDGAEEELVKG